MQDYVKQLDPTRPVTYAAPEDDVFRGINCVIEVRGWNYHLRPRKWTGITPSIRTSRTSAPSRPASSARAAFTTNDTAARLRRRLRRRTGRAGRTTAESWWSFFADRPWLSGGFRLDRF